MSRFDLIGQTAAVPLYYNRKIGHGLRPLADHRLKELAGKFAEYATAEEATGNVTMARRLYMMAWFIDRALKDVPFPEA